MVRYSNTQTRLSVLARRWLGKISPLNWWSGNSLRQPDVLVHFAVVFFVFKRNLRCENIVATGVHQGHNERLAFILDVKDNALVPDWSSTVPFLSLGLHFVLPELHVGGLECAKVDSVDNMDFEHSVVAEPRVHVDFAWLGQIGFL